VSEEHERPGETGPGADLHRRIDRIVAAVTVLARVSVLAMVGLSAAAGVQTHAYGHVTLAIATYLVVAAYGLTLAALVVRPTTLPAWALPVDVAVSCAAVIALPLAADEHYFTAVANADFEPVIVSCAVAVALITASTRWTAVSCALLAAAYAIGQTPLIRSATDVTSAISPILWLVATAWCCCVFIQRLRTVADAVDAANGRLLAQREQVAAERAEAEARRRHFTEQLRRHRALHDGPLRILTAIAGPGPLGHPDPAARRACAIAINVLRGTTPDDPGGTLTDLSLALIEAAGDCTAAGLRVQYHFAGLPDDLPGEVVTAFAQAAAEALSNTATHAGTTRARLTALATGAPDRQVTVAVVDQGKGFDPETVETGYGIRQSILGRMREVGGDASLDSHPGQGTRVDLRWPA
jgi:signal transduction histidine kinase